VARALLGAALLAFTLRAAGTQAIALHLMRLDARALLLGVAIGVPQLLLLAGRWRFTARALGLSLDYRHAVREYGLSLFANSTLPFGVLGDAARVMRHARVIESGGPGVGAALRAVVLERASGQLVVVLFALAALPLWAHALAPEQRDTALHVLGGALLTGVALLPLAARWLSPPLRQALSVFVHDAKLALLAPRVLIAQLAWSSAILLTLLAQLACALYALGLALHPLDALRIVPFVLLSMTLPFSVAGFGAREAATAALYHLAGLHPAEGAAFAVAYGVLAFGASVPGAVWFFAAPAFSERRT
jgi:uncharacterized membrane protein YbhN (UPF0104 family)